MDQIKSTSKFLHYSFVRLIHVVRDESDLYPRVVYLAELNMMRKLRDTYLAILHLAT